ncbi:MAG: LacI family DNA-binding transcriptional regulator [Thermoguttaceae bacterium]|jgi:LacI family transcriptional regulator
MTRSYKIVRRIRREILQGVYGGGGDRFLTVRDLAARSGVSLSTAHKVMTQLKGEGLLVADSTNPAIINPEVVQTRSAAGESRPRRLGLLVANIASPFFGSLCRQVQQAGLDLGYQVLAANSEYDFSQEQRAIEGFLSIGMEGLLICPGLADNCAKMYRDLLGRGVPIVFVSRWDPEIDADYVVAHSFVGAAAVAGHLLSMGYRSFGYIAFGSRLKRDARLSGFRSALAEEGITLAPENIASGEGRDIEHGYRAMAALMQSAERPRAVLAYNDLLAIGAIRYCHDRGISVPGDVAVAGFDNLPESRVTTPPLTTVDYGVESMARLAVWTLLDRIRNPQRPASRTLLEPHLIVRQSTDPEALHSSAAGAAASGAPAISTQFSTMREE